MQKSPVLKESQIWGWAVTNELLNFWPKSQAEGLAAELPIKKCVPHWVSPHRLSHYFLTFSAGQCRAMSQNVTLSSSWSAQFS